MNRQIPTGALSTAPGIVYEPNPADELHPTFVKLFAAGWAFIGAVEFAALYIEAKNRKNGASDRRKRTLTAIIRFLAGTDSVTGVPVDVPYGRMRRFALSTLIGPGWFPGHFGQEQRM
jgi:hypothetical protein